MKKNHRVEFVDDAALPDGTDWVLARDGETHYLFVRESAVLGDVLSEAWVAFHRSTVELPEPRGSINRLRLSLALMGVAAIGLQPWLTTSTLAAGL